MIFQEYIKYIFLDQQKIKTLQDGMISYLGNVTVRKVEVFDLSKEIRADVEQNRSIG